MDKETMSISDQEKVLINDWRGIWAENERLGIDTVW